MNLPLHCKIAIAIPVYNGENTLEEALQNIADQEYQNFRAFIYENKSTDRSPEIAKKFCEKDPRFEIVESSQHIGMIDNFLRAIKHASGMAEYFCMRACDDKSSSDYISKLVAALEADKTKLLAGSDAERIDGSQIKRMKPNDNIFNFLYNLTEGKLPRNLNFPSEWIYGVFRSKGGAEILLRRLPELKSPWAAASYTVTEFVVRDMVEYVDGPVYKIYAGSNSVDLYFFKNWIEKVKQRWKFTSGCFQTRKFLPKMSFGKHIKFFRMCWNDSRRKTRYSLIGFQKRPSIFIKVANK